MRCTVQSKEPISKIWRMKRRLVNFSKKHVMSLGKFRTYLSRETTKVLGKVQYFKLPISSCISIISKISNSYLFLAGSLVFYRDIWNFCCAYFFEPFLCLCCIASCYRKYLFSKPCYVRTKSNNLLMETIFTCASFILSWLCGRKNMLLKYQAV